MDFPLQPYVGAGPLNLLAPKDAFIDVLGAPIRSSKRPSGERLSWEQGIVALFSKHSAGGVSSAVEIAFTPRCPQVSFQGMPVFENPKDLLNKIALADSAPLYGDGYLVLRTLGIWMTGFVENLSEERVIGLFAPGHWDNNLDGMKPYLPKV